MAEETEERGARSVAFPLGVSFVMTGLLGMAFNNIYFVDLETTIFGEIALWLMYIGGVMLVIKGIAVIGGAGYGSIAEAHERHVQRRNAGQAARDAATATAATGASPQDIARQAGQAAQAAAPGISSSDAAKIGAKAARTAVQPGAPGTLVPTSGEVLLTSATKGAQKAAAPTKEAKPATPFHYLLPLLESLLPSA